MKRLALAAIGLAVVTQTMAPSTNVWAAGQDKPAAFRGTISRIDATARRLMVGRSWRPGCPVPMRDLRLLGLTYWGFDRETHRGHLVVHKRWAKEMLTVFESLYGARYPVRRMRLVDRYGANDALSMAADNTSAFNCRWRAGSPGVWSQHAYGSAIDINPVENPMFVPPNDVSPAAGWSYLDRHGHRRGMIEAHDVVVRAFAAVGWEWGGTWHGTKDWQHFSANGR